MTVNNEPSPNDAVEAQRETIRRSLNEITAEINSALVATGLACPFYMCVPTSGNALFTFACPLDPSDDDWDRVNDIACEIVGKKVNARLRSTELPCAMAGTTMSAADVTMG